MPNRIQRTLLPLFLFLQLSGCLDAGTPDPNQGTTNPRLADFLACEFQAGQDVIRDCPNAAQVVVPQVSPPAGWLCVDEARFGGTGVTIYRSPANEIGIRYAVSEHDNQRGRPVRGLILAGQPNAQNNVDPDSASTIRGWNGADSTGFVFLGTPPRPLLIEVHAYGLDYDGGSANVVVHWVRHAGALWPVDVVVVNEQVHYFPAFHVLDERPVPRNVSVSGSDFTVQVNYTKFFNAALTLSDTFIPNTDCETEIGF